MTESRPDQSAIQVLPEVRIKPMCANESNFGRKRISNSFDSPPLLQIRSLSCDSIQGRANTNLNKHPNGVEGQTLSRFDFVRQEHDNIFVNFASKTANKTPPFQRKDFLNPNRLPQQQMYHSSGSTMTNNQTNKIISWAPEPTFPRMKTNGSSYPTIVHSDTEHISHPSPYNQKPTSLISEEIGIKSQSKKPRFLMASVLAIKPNQLSSGPLNLETKHQLSSQYKNVPFALSSSESSDSTGMSEYFDRNESTDSTENNFQSRPASAIRETYYQSQLQHMAPKRLDSQYLLEESRTKRQEDFNLIQRNPNSGTPEGEYSKNQEKIFDQNCSMTNQDSDLEPRPHHDYRMASTSEETIIKVNTLSSKISSVRSQLNNILDGFAFVTGKIASHSESAEEIIGFHQRKKSLVKSTVMAHLKIFESTISKFAMSQPMFASLSKQDQNVLLENNVPLYIQYILARYFSAESGLEQIAWLMEGQISLKSIEEVKNLHFIGLREFNEKTEIIGTEPLEKLYKCYSNNVGTFYAFPQQCNGLIANMLIYR